jgi:hypothetical protein
MMLTNRVHEESLVGRVKLRVLESTHGRIRNLEVEEVQGRVEVRGRVPSHHMKQLALHGALQLLPCERFCSKIVVG